MEIAFACIAREITKPNPDYDILGVTQIKGVDRFPYTVSRLILVVGGIHEAHEQFDGLPFSFKATLIDEDGRAVCDPRETTVQPPENMREAFRPYWIANFAGTTFRRPQRCQFEVYVGGVRKQTLPYRVFQRAQGG